ncbi:hypothetical protein COBT_003197 [Conglomerata obtusa]
MWPKSLNGTTYDIEHIKIKDKVVYDFKYNKTDFDDDQLTCCKYTINCLQNTYLIKFKKVLRKYEGGYVELIFELYIKNTTKNEKPLILNDHIYYVKLHDGYCFKHTACGVSNSHDLEDLYLFIKYLANYNPNFVPRVSFIIERNDNTIHYTETYEKKKFFSPQYKAFTIS